MQTILHNVPHHGDLLRYFCSVLHYWAFHTLTLSNDSPNVDILVWYFVRGHAGSFVLKSSWLYYLEFMFVWRVSVRYCLVYFSKISTAGHRPPPSPSTKTVMCGPHSSLSRNLGPWIVEVFRIFITVRIPLVNCHSWIAKFPIVKTRDAFKKYFMKWFNDYNNSVFSADSVTLSQR